MENLKHIASELISIGNNSHSSSSILAADNQSYQQQQHHYQYTDNSRVISSSFTGSAIDDEILRHENPNNCTDLAPALSLNEYKLMVDNNPRVIRIKPREKVCYSQEIAVKYLKPPEPLRSEDIIVEELPGKQIAPAPALVERVEGARAVTPPPIVIREAPPEPPRPLQGKVITIPGKIYPPPARKVVVEKLPPEPPKPPKVIIERWLPYGQQTQRVVHRPAQKKPCFVPDPKNVIIEWQQADVEIRKDVKNLGISEADPRDYIQRYGSALVRSDQLPELAITYGNPAQFQMERHYRVSESPLLVGDVEALNLIDLDKHGLGYLRGLIHAGSVHRSSSNLASWDNNYAAQDAGSYATETHKSYWTSS
jgi:hypothetical protein